MFPFAIELFHRPEVPMSLVLSFAERRVLGVLIEKGFTTPEQYPLTLNGLVVGCNQKSCRDPVSNLSEEGVLDAIDALRQKGLLTIVRGIGSRTDRYKHRCGETLGIESKEAAVLAELLLRGPQTDGELRQRAGRMVPLPSLPELTAVIEKLRARPESLVVRLGSESRRRGVKFAHTLYPESERPVVEDAVNDGVDFEPEELAPSYGGSAAPRERFPQPALGEGHSLPVLSERPRVASGSDSAAAEGEIEQLRRELAGLRERVEELEATFARFFR
jgi:uncharacterized protein YceH (UPF0502 family)